MASCPDDATWHRLLSDEVGQAETEELEGHLDGCAACRDRLESLAGGLTTVEGRGPEVPGYQTLGELGRGGMGVVYLAMREGHDRPVALKVLGPSAGPTSLARMAREARALGQLEHPNIVRVLDVGMAGGQPYLAMDWVEGGDLASRLRAGPMPPQEAARVIRAVALAVASAHDRGIVHRDIKPSNILIAADGTPRLTDFGLAHEFDSASFLTSAGAALGTPAYMPPEQVDSHHGKLGPGSDVYSLGATLFHLLSGLPPFRGGNAAQLLRRVAAEEPAPPRAIDPSIPETLEAICLRCLEKRPRRRYASARALADDLDRFLDGKRVKARRGPAGRALRWARTHPRAASAAAATVLVLGGLIAAEESRVRAAERAAARAAADADSRSIEPDGLLKNAIHDLDWMFESAWPELYNRDPETRRLFQSALGRMEPFYELYLNRRPFDAPWSSVELRMLHALTFTKYVRDRQGEVPGTLLRFLELAWPFLEAHPDDSALALTLADAECQVAEWVKVGRLPGPVVVPYERAYRAALRVAPGSISEEGPFRARLRASFELSNEYRAAKRFPDAARVEREALEFARRFRAERPGVAPVEMYLILHLARLAELELDQGRPGEAAPLIEEGEARVSRLPAKGIANTRGLTPAGLRGEFAGLRTRLAATAKRQ